MKTLDEIIKRDWQIVINDNVDLIDLEAIKDDRWYNLAFKPSPKTCLKIYDSLQKIVPDSLKSKVFFQPFEGYHFTLQWTQSDKQLDLDIKGLIQDLNKALTEFSPLKGTINYPLFGKAGSMGWFETIKNDEFTKIRQAIKSIWEKHHLELGFKENLYDLAYISLTRFTNLLTDKEKYLLKELKTWEIEDVVLDEIWLSYANKFMNPAKTEVIKRFLLHP
jgi:hypothetical protein